MREQTMVEEERSQRLYDALAEMSSGDFSGYESDVKAPTVPGELAYLLRELLAQAERKLGLDRGDAFAEMIDLGLVEWCRRLDDRECELLGIPFFGCGAIEKDEAREPTKAQSKDHGSSADENWDRELISLKRELETERCKVRELNEQLRALEASAHPDPEKAQDPYGLNGAHAPGYIPLSSHSLRGPDPQGRRGIRGSRKL